MVLSAGCGEDDTGGTDTGSGGSNPASGGGTGVGGGGASTGGTTGSGGSNPASGGGTGVGGGGAEPPPACEARATDTLGNQILTADAAHNYSFSSTLTITPVEVEPSSNLLIDWSSVTQDFLRHPVDPVNDIDAVNVFVWDLPLAELQQKLNDDTLKSRDLNIFCNVFPIDARGMTSANLYDFGVNRDPIDPDPAEAQRILRDYLDPTLYPPETTSYTVMTQKGDVQGEGTLMIQAFVPVAGVTNTTVNVTDASTALQFEADLHSLQKTYVAPGVSTFAVDWFGLTVNAMSKEVDPYLITEVMVSKYTETPAELEGDKFLDLELIDTASWSAEVGLGTSIALSQLQADDGSGSFFPGIDDSGTWMLALRCGDCRNPAPWFMTVLAPCTP